MEYFSYIQHSYITTNEIHENFYRESGSYDENMPEKEGKNLFLGLREPRSVKVDSLRSSLSSEKLIKRIKRM